MCMQLIVLCNKFIAFVFQVSEKSAPLFIGKVFILIWYSSRQTHTKDESNLGPFQYKYRLKRKEKNKSLEEIFYQMKGFFFFC